MTEPRYDPTGSVIVEMRADPAIMATVNNRDLAITGNEARVDPPYIAAVNQTVNPRPFGRGSNRLGLATWRYAFRCVAPKGSVGDIQAMAMAGAVAAHFGNRGWRSRVVSGTKQAFVRSDESTTTGPVEDPDTKDPTCLVFVDLIATSQGVT